MRHLLTTLIGVALVLACALPATANDITSVYPGSRGIAIVDPS